MIDVDLSSKRRQILWILNPHTLPRSSNGWKVTDSICSRSNVNAISDRFVLPITGYHSNGSIYIKIQIFKKSVDSCDRIDLCSSSIRRWCNQSFQRIDNNKWPKANWYHRQRYDWYTLVRSRLLCRSRWIWYGSWEAVHLVDHTVISNHISPSTHV